MNAPIFATLGCRLNAYETEAMKELAAAAGLERYVLDARGPAGIAAEPPLPGPLHRPEPLPGADVLLCWPEPRKLWEASLHIPRHSDHKPKPLI